MSLVFIVVFLKKEYFIWFLCKERIRFVMGVKLDSFCLFCLNFFFWLNFLKGREGEVFWKK